MSYHNGCKFSTKDNDNDANGRNCAAMYQGAWWHCSCAYSSLNGLYDGSSYQAIVWYYWKSAWESLKFSEMKICCN